MHVAGDELASADWDDSGVAPVSSGSDVPITGRLEWTVHRKSETNSVASHIPPRRFRMARLLLVIIPVCTCLHLPPALASRASRLLELLHVCWFVWHIFSLRPLTLFLNSFKIFYAVCGMRFHLGADLVTSSPVCAGALASTGLDIPRAALQGWPDIPAVTSARKVPQGLTNTQTSSFAILCSLVAAAALRCRQRIRSLARTSGRTRRLQETCA